MMSRIQEGMPGLGDKVRSEDEARGKQMRQQSKGRKLVLRSQEMMNSLEGQEVEPWVDLQLRNLTRTGNKGYHLRSRKGRLFSFVYVGHNEKNKSHLKTLV